MSHLTFRPTLGRAPARRRIGFRATLAIAVAIAATLVGLADTSVEADTAMKLPWQAGQWNVTQGLHTTRAWDFQPLDRSNAEVLAITAGTARIVCSDSIGQANVELVTSAGRFLYAHLRTADVTAAGISTTATQVPRGRVLGRLFAAAGGGSYNGGCGSGTGTHLHLEMPAVPIVIDGVTFSSNGPGGVTRLTSSNQRTTGGAVGNGEFVSHGGHVYRIAGGAPIYVSSWNSFDGPKPTRALSDAQFSALRSVPADGTAISSSVTGRVFIVAGGSPQYVSSWSAIGGQRPTVTVDEAAVDRAGEAGVWSHLRRYPANGSYIRGAGSGRIYRVAGGAPIYVTSWAAMGGQQPTTTIDDAAIDRAGTGGSTWGHLRATPVNMFLQGAKSKRIFRVMDGHPYYVPSFAPYGGTQPFVSVDDTSIDRCDHLDCRPFGALDAAQGGAGTIKVAGWTMDPNTSDPIAVRIAVDGKVVKEVRASRSRPDVDKVYHRGSNFGVDVNVTTAAGARQVCVTAVNVGRGQDRRLGQCRSTTVAQAPAIRSVKPPTVSGKARVGARLRAGSGTWEPGSVSTSYQWRVDGKTIKGATGSSLKLKKAHRGKRVTVTVTARRDGYRSMSATSARTKKVR